MSLLPELREWTGTQAEMRERHQTHELADDQKVCEHCGGTEFVELPRTEDSIEYEYMPARLPCCSSLK